MVLRWDLDECTGSVANDLSGRNNQGVLSNVTWSTDTPSKKACSLHVDVSAATSLITTTLNSTLYFSNITISSWFKTTDSGTGVSPYYFDFRIVNGGYFQFCLNGCLQSSKRFNDGKWHLVVITGDSKNVLVYIDGENRPELTRPPDSGNISNFVLGSYNGSTNHINEFDELRMYSRALSSREIHQLYAEGLSQHLASRQWSLSQ